MRKFWTLAATLLLAGSVALAQSSGSTAAPSPTPGAQTTVVRGCLKSAGGSYTLNSGGTTYQLTGNTNDLAANVDKTVEISGTNLSDQNQQATQPNQQSFSVQSVSMINDKCESNVGQTSDTQGMTNAVSNSPAASPTGSSTQPDNPGTLKSAPPQPNDQTPAPENNNPNNTTAQPQSQSSLGTGTAGTTSDMNSQASNSSAATTPSSTTGSDMNATTTTSQSSANSTAAGASPSTTPSDQSASTSQSNPQSMNSPTASASTAQTANPTGETNATGAGAAADQSANGAAAGNAATSDQTGAASSASQTPSAGTSASENAQGTETAQANTGKKSGNLPQTASPLPLLSLVGMGSLASGLIARLRK